MKTQKIFMEVVSETRRTQLFTYPVLTYSLIYKDGKFQDEEFAKWASNHNRKWNDANFFISETAGALSTVAALSAIQHSLTHLLTLLVVQHFQ